MKITELQHILQSLRNLTAENEIVEFKEAKNGYDFNKLGKYFSALSNEANLKGKPHAWLVFGVENKKHQIVGSQFRLQRKDLDSLKSEIANKTTNRITFIEIYELIETEGRVVMFQIPAAPKGFPIAFDGHYYGRDDEELSPLNLEEIERIRAQATIEDWSAAIIESASISDLDPKAILIARTNYKDKYKHLANEVDDWDDITFLNKAKITINGKITRTAIILLGRSEAEHFLSPSIAKIAWILKDNNKVEKDYIILSCPFILAIDVVFAKIRNLTYRYITDTTLFPEETPMYETYNIRESINNCIAHQDYSLGGRINVVEFEDKLVFTNLGRFIPGSVENVLESDAPTETYRNKFLSEAMSNLKMVDTIGSGIKRMYINQRNKYFPMPDYLISDNKVQVTLIGKILDIEYARVLAQNKDLTLNEIILLDKVQKKIKLISEEEKILKSRNLIEGRKPNYFISLKIAHHTNQKATYSKNKAFDKMYYHDFITKSIKEHGSLNRKDVDDLLWNKLPEWMDEKQKKIKVNHLLSELREKDKIKNIGSFRKPKWILTDEH